MVNCYAGDGTNTGRYDVVLVLVFPRFALLSGYQCVVVYLSCIPLVTQQLGLGDTIDRNIPTQVELDGCRLRKVACGWWHTLLLADSPT